ncbi:MAG TPA: hypothetical protein VMV76_02005 [Dehalococcoidia bacterium]|nr:hypothetical protein [Dehalococcoidia bacterium]
MRNLIFNLILEVIVETIFSHIQKAVVGWGRAIVTAFGESASRGLLCLFVPPYAIYYATELKRQRPEVESVITKFMEAGVARNVEAAYACCSPHSLTKEEIAGLIERSYKVFASYERLAISSQNPKSSGGINSYHVKGDIIYTGNQGWPFEAWLVKDNDVWKITGIQIGSAVTAVKLRWWRDKKKLVIIGLVTVAGVIGAIAVPSLIHFSGVEPVIAEFMEAGAARNVEAAYGCWSPQSVTEEDIAEFIESSYDVFAGYERVDLNSLSGQSGGGISEAYVKGAIIYTGGQRLPLEAHLVEEDDVWKIIGIRIGSTALFFT